MSRTARHQDYSVHRESGLAETFEWRRHVAAHYCDTEAADTKTHCLHLGFPRRRCRLSACYGTERRAISRDSRGRHSAARWGAGKMLMHPPCVPDQLALPFPALALFEQSVYEKNIRLCLSVQLGDLHEVECILIFSVKHLEEDSSHVVDQLQGFS